MNNMITIATLCISASAVKIQAQEGIWDIFENDLLYDNDMNSWGPDDQFFVPEFDEDILN